MNRPYYKKNKYKHCMDECDCQCNEEDMCECSDETECEPVQDCDCPTDPDLLLLRKNAKGEREAIAFYLRAASQTTGELCELFLDTARDEMMHFRNSMALLAKYDPGQDEAFDEVGIRLPAKHFRKGPLMKSCSNDTLGVIDLLTKSISGELEAINMYQESYEAACHDDVKSLFCDNANDEKLHVAEFWKALMCFTKEDSFKA